MNFSFETLDVRRHIDNPIVFSFDAIVLSPTAIEIMWDEESGASYQTLVLRNASDSTAIDSEWLVWATRDFTFGDLSPNTTYEIDLYLNNDGSSGYTADATTTATTTGVDAPTNVNATTDPINGIDLTFTPTANAVSYDIYRTPADGIHTNTLPDGGFLAHVFADQLTYADDGYGNTLAQYYDSTGLDGVNYSYSLVANTSDGLSSAASAPAAAPAFHPPTIVTDSKTEPINQPYSISFDGGSIAGTITGTSSFTYTYQYTDTRASVSAQISVDFACTGSGPINVPIANTKLTGTASETGEDHWSLSFMFDATRPNTASPWMLESGSGVGHDNSIDNVTYSAARAPYTDNSGIPRCRSR